MKMRNGKHPVLRRKTANMSPTQQFVLALVSIVAVLGIVVAAALLNRPDILLALKLLF